MIYVLYICVGFRLLVHLTRDLCQAEKNKFEVSKIYMTACMCIYKFCQTKEYLFMIFFCFIQKPEGYFYDSSWFFMFYSRSWMFYYMYIKNIHVLLHLKKYISDFSRFFQIFHVLFKILNNIHVLSLIFMKYSRFFKMFQIIYVLLKILNDFLFMYFIN